MRVVKVSFVFALLTAAAASAFAQATSSALLGTIVDPSHLAVVGAEITVTYRDTGATRTGVSSDQGTFAVPDLVPGNYSVEIAAKGFKSLHFNNIGLSFTEKRKWAIHLTQVATTCCVVPGDALEVVTIAA